MKQQNKMRYSAKRQKKEPKGNYGTKEYNECTEEVKRFDSRLC